MRRDPDGRAGLADPRTPALGHAPDAPDGDDVLAPEDEHHESSSSRVPLFASLALRNYRLFAAGSLVSNVGTWMSRVGQDWLVLTQLTDHSATALGVVTGLQFAPIALLSPLAGAFADRYPKRRLLQITQALGMLTGFCLLYTSPSPRD